MKLLILIGTGLFTAVLVFGTNWLALVPWRKASGQHWIEQARLYYPVRLSAVSNLFIVPATVTMLWALLFPLTSPHWAWLVLVTGVGTLLGTLPMDREVFPRISWPELLRQLGFASLSRFLLWFVFLSATALMPAEFNLQVVLLSFAVVAACVAWNYKGWLVFGRKLGWIVPAPPRLKKVADQTAFQLHVQFKQIWMLRSPVAQAFACPATGVLLFTERLLALFSDEEIATICAHEMAHLAESRWQYSSRYVVWLIFLPWMLITPLIHNLGAAGFFLLLLNTIAMSLLYGAISRRLETSADKVAHISEPDPGAYARTLLRLHEDSLIPAVLAKRHATHPHLYDRLVAAGVTPEFPRPIPAASAAWHGRIFSMAAGVLAMLLILRLVEGK